MLYSVDSGKYVTKLPHKNDFDRWMKQLSIKDYEKVVAALNKVMDQGNIQTSGWIPGHDWSGTDYMPLYVACGCNEAQAGMFFGLILFKVLMERPDKVWGFGRYEMNGRSLGSITYFVLDNPPKM